MDVERWIDDRLATLDTAADWRPDSVRALAQIRARDHRSRVIRGTSIAVLAASVATLAVVVPPMIRPPREVLRPIAPTPAPAPILLPVAPEPEAPAPRRAAVKIPKPIICEIYTDYQCPPCRTILRGPLPPQIAEYIKTGKVKLVYRDFPLPTHRYARLAARYAVAARDTSHYDLVVKQLYDTQPTWSVDGNVEEQLAKVLDPTTLAKLRELATDPAIDARIDADIAAARDDGIRSVPSAVIVSRGARQTFGPLRAWEPLAEQLDRLLADAKR